MKEYSDVVQHLDLSLKMNICSGLRVEDSVKIRWIAMPVSTHSLCCWVLTPNGLRCVGKTSQEEISSS